MIAELAPLLTLSKGWLLATFIVFSRVGSAVFLLPGFSMQTIPMRVRLALGFAFTLILLPIAPPQPPLSGLKILPLFLSETVIGLMCGFGLRCLIWLLQMAGSMAAQATSLAQIFGGGATDPQPAIGHLLVSAGLALAVLAGLHVRIVEVFLISYEIFPPGTLPSGGDAAQWALGRIGQSFALAFAFAAPFVISSLIYNLALGVINRAMPQLMVAFVGAPAITMGGLLLTLVSLPILLPLWLETVAHVTAAPFGTP